MKIAPCPACGYVINLLEIANNANAMTTLRLLSEMPSVGPYVPAYIDMFRNPDTNRDLSWGRKLSLVSELKTLTSETRVQWDRQPARHANADTWKQALLLTAEYAKRPLKNHNYLRKTAYGIASQKAHEAETRKNAAENTGKLLRLPVQTENPKRMGITAEEVRTMRIEKGQKSFSIIDDEAAPELTVYHQAPALSEKQMELRKKELARQFREFEEEKQEEKHA
ncbi:MAG: hypothetical protein GY749_02850 [Desulfobacteraceae bacterium]|nr:hypothetical protein [Desulfobacteraceae bacterium]